MHWKIARDEFLGPLVETHGEAIAWDAGFFFDTDAQDAPLDDVDWLCTPRPRCVRSGERPVVLLTTGAFCPIHDGHLAMMSAARDAASRAGFTVIGGYISPGHDDYVRLKCGMAAIPASVRLEQCATAAASTDWLVVDSWEALHRRVSVNYTDVAARLRRYLRKHVDERVDVLYVAGGDNARFALAFQQDAGCVVVGRPGAAEAIIKYRAQLEGNPRVLWKDGNHTAASSSIRGSVPFEATVRPCVVRLEDERAARTLRVDLRSFQEQLLAALPAARAIRTQVAAQRSQTISLDPFSAADHALAVSRLFALGGHQLLGYVPRPGARSLQDQIDALPSGEYTLLDDDRMSGGTLAAILSMLPPRVRIARTELMLATSPDEDILDSRDFLVGSDEGGLVVQLPDGNIGRAPYLLPYVDPAARASVADARAFSIELWKINARVLGETDLKVSDLPDVWQPTFKAHIGKSLRALCEWHVERLHSLTPRRP